MLEVRQQGVKVTTIAPGSVDTTLRRRAARRTRPGCSPADDVAAGGAGSPRGPRDGAHLEPGRDAARRAPRSGRDPQAAPGSPGGRFGRFHDHNGPDRAAAVAYYTLLSLLPLFIFVISLGVDARRARSTPRTAARSSCSAASSCTSTPAPWRRCAPSSSAPCASSGRPSLLLAWTSRRIFGSLFARAGARSSTCPAHGFATGNLLAFGMVVVTGPRPARSPCR